MKLKKKNRAIGGWNWKKNQLRMIKKKLSQPILTCLAHDQSQEIRITL